MNAQTLRTLKAGDYFHLSIGGKPGATVYVRGHYDRASRKFSIYKFHDVNAETLVSALRPVFLADF